MLVLFDVDLTLIRTDSAGMRALVAAGRDLFGDGFTSEGVPYGGRLDPLIIRDLLDANGIEPTEDRATALRRGYGQRLKAELEGGNPERVGPMPGAATLIDHLRAVQDAGEACLGLLTGNFPETGAIKLRHCGIEPEWFPCRVWGDDSPHTPPHRDHLPQVAMDRHTAMFGRPVDPARVVIVGDTEHDVRCALANGCRVLAVATGRVPVQALADAGAHRVVEDLTATEDIASWLLDPAPATAGA